MGEAAPGAIDKVAYLRSHIEGRYDVQIDDLTQLDRGVFSVALADGRRWVARVFPEKRPVAQVEGDAEALRWLAQQGYAAERCAVADAVFALGGRGVLITEYIQGASADTGASGPTLKALGEALGRLHTLSVSQGAVAREAGALHHYAPAGGGPERDLLAADRWLSDLEDHVAPSSRAAYASLRRRLTDADRCHDLPTAFIHPDPVLKNALLTDQGAPVFIDWTGAGQGPRIASLAVLIWSCALKSGGWSPRRVDAVMAGYASQARLEESELARLAAVMQIRPLVFACWRFRHAVMAGHAPDGSEWWRPDDDLPQAVAARVRAAVSRLV